MMKYILFLCLFTITAFGQNTFKNGSYISTDGITVEGFIYDYDWKYTPVNFKFKNNLAQTQERKIDVAEVKSFMVGRREFISARVNIDESSDRTESLSRVLQPEYVEKTLFLEKLVDGEASLYVYETTLFTRFFISKSGGVIEPLRYRRFIMDDLIKTSTPYRQNLLQLLSGERTQNVDFAKLNYSKADLMSLVKKYNGDTSNYKPERKMRYNLGVRPGVYLADLSMFREPFNPQNISFTPKVGFRLGIENEIILPYNNGSWSLIIEPTYQHYSHTYSRVSSDVFVPSEEISVKYNSVELPMGIRRYFFIGGSTSSLFINAGYLIDFRFASEMIRNDAPFLEIKPLGNFFGGVGFDFKKSVYAEFRYNHNRPLYYYANHGSDFKTISFILGLKLKK